MNEILLEHAELLVLLDAIDATAIAGIAQKELFPQDERERRAVLQQGRSHLEQRGLLQAGQLHPDLLRLARILARPQIALMLVRNESQAGPQLFVSYLAQEGIVERALLNTRVHRLVALDSVPLLLARTIHLLSLPEETPDKASLEIEQETFFQVNALAQQGLHQAALKLLQLSGATPAITETLLTALEHPDFRGEVALLQCADQTVVHGRDVFIVRDQADAWYATQITPGQPRLRIESADALIVHSLLSRYLVDLAQPAG
jgi:hypothetical protein